jgi:hypothetical protein
MKSTLLKFGLILVIVVAGLVVAAGFLNLGPIPPSRYEQPQEPHPEASSARTGTSSTANWGTYTNPEDFYSIQYPDRGMFLVRYTAEPKRTILGWKSVADYDVEIYFIDPDGLNLQQWLTTNTVAVAGVQKIMVNGMNGVVDYMPSGGILSAYLEHDIGGFPFIYQIDFVCFYHGQCPPAFWQQMLNSFRVLPFDG